MAHDIKSVMCTNSLMPPLVEWPPLKSADSTTYNDDVERDAQQEYVREASRVAIGIRVELQVFMHSGADLLINLSGKPTPRHPLNDCCGPPVRHAERAYAKAPDKFTSRMIGGAIKNSPRTPNPSKV